MKGLESELNRLGVNLLLTDSDVALTYIGIAEASVDGWRRNQALQDAQRAYDVISQKRLEFSFSELESRLLDQKLEELRVRLKRLRHA
jgi:hypothetical protein